MAANTIPIHPRIPLVSHNIITPSITANTRTDGDGTIGTNMVLVASAGADGTFFRFARIKVYATTSPTTTTPTVIRLFRSTQSSGATTSINTSLIAEMQIPAMSAANTTAALPDFDISLNISLPTGQHLLACTSVVAAANSGFAITAFGGSY